MVASSGGYPGSYKTGFPITGLGAAAHVAGRAGLSRRHGAYGRQLVTAGGRVLGVTAAADSLDEALARAYQAMAEIQFEGIITAATSATGRCKRPNKSQPAAPTPHQRRMEV